MTFIEFFFISIITKGNSWGKLTKGQGPVKLPILAKIARFQYKKKSLYGAS